MDPLSITVSVTALLGTAAQVIQAASALRSRYREAAFMLSAISSECTVINTSLAMLQGLMVSNLDNLRSRMTDNVLSTFDVALMGCSLTMSVIEEELGGLLVQDDDGNMKARRIKYVMDQDHLKEMLQQIRGQQVGVTLLLQTYQAESTAEVNDIAHKNNVLLRQIANRGRSFYLESIHDSERRSTVAPSIRTSAMSDFEMSSVIDDRQFDFDDEITNATAYRRALANLRSKSRFHDVDDDLSSVASVEEAPVPPQATTEEQHSSQTRSTSATGESSNNSTAERTESSATTTSIALDLGDPFSTTMDDFYVPARPHRYRDGTLVSLNPRVFEPKRPLIAERSIIDPITGEVFDKTKRSHPPSEAQLVELEQKALASRGIQQMINDTGRLRSQDQIESLMKEDKGRFGFSEVGGSTVTPAMLHKDPVNVRKLKFVILGDGAAGKTYAIMKYLTGHTKGIPYAPTVYANYTSDIKIDGYHCQVTWEDTTGQDDYDRLRPIAYPDCHVALLIFAIDNPDSLTNIMAKWLIEINQYHPSIPKILVGCKIDLRDDPLAIEELAKTSQKPITRLQGEQLASSLNRDSRRANSKGTSNGQVKYMECSAFTGEGIKELFEEAARLGISYTDANVSKALDTKQRRISSLFRRTKAQQPFSPIPEEGATEGSTNFRVENFFHVQ